MRILIIGAGKVGSSVAGNLVSESNDITIVDTNKAKIAEIQSNYDLQGIVGDATSPSVLADAGAVDADMIIAVTANDETNLAAMMSSESIRRFCRPPVSVPLRLFGRRKQLLTTLFS